MRFAGCASVACPSPRSSSIVRWCRAATARAAGRAPRSSVRRSRRSCASPAEFRSATFPSSLPAVRGHGAVKASGGAPRVRRTRARSGTLMNALAASRILVVAGKGGVGETTVAAALAQAVAAGRPPRRVLVLSVDPAHSLADDGLPLGDAASRVQGAEGRLHAREVDAGRRARARAESAQGGDRPRDVPAWRRSSRGARPRPRGPGTTARSSAAGSRRDRSARL